MSIFNSLREKDPTFACSIIYTGIKNFDIKIIEKQLEETFRLASKHPKLRFGFDLVDNEDGLKQISDFKKLLISDVKRLKAKYKADVALTLHAGESFKSCNMNLYDAILMKT